MRKERFRVRRSLFSYSANPRVSALSPVSLSEDPFVWGRAVRSIVKELVAAFRGASGRGPASVQAASTQSAPAHSATGDMFDMDLDDRAAAPQSMRCVDPANM